MAESSSKVKNMDIPIPTLIESVKKRRALYDTSMLAYRDRYKKKKMWDEVYKEVCSTADWSNMSTQEKLDYGFEIQKKWSSLRNCFRREVIRQNLLSSGVITKKKRKYYHFDSLLFLLPFTEKSFKPSADRQNTQTEDTEEEEYSEESSDSSNANLHKTFEEEELMVPIGDVKEEKVFLNSDNNMFNASNTKDTLKAGTSKSNTSNEIQSTVSDDGDKAFLESLLLTMREFTSDQKLLLRIEIMKTIVKFKQTCKQS